MTLRPIPIAAVVLFIVLGVVFSIANPIHEATDEIRHYRYVRYLADFGRLPVQSGEQGNAQAHHPPLYYATAALASFWINVTDPLYTPEPNPHWGFRNWEIGTDNKNLYIHGPDEAWPFRDAALASRAARWVTVLWGAGAVLFTYLISREVFPNEPAIHLTATGLIALNPMFLYLGGAVNNDVPAALAAAAITYLCVVTVRDGLTRRRAVLFGVLYGLAMLVKFNLLAMAAPIALAMLIAPHTEGRRFRQIAETAAIAAAAALAICGWWYVRNTILYGEPTGFLRLTEIWGFREPTEGVSLTIPELCYAWTSLWGRFGYGQIPLPTPIYTILAVVCGVGGLGIMVWAVHTRREDSVRTRMILVLAASALVNFAVLYAYITVSPAGAMGRFFFPGLPAFVILVAAGIVKWLPDPAKLPAAGTITAVMAAIVWIALTGYLIPAYRVPPAVDPPTAVDPVPVSDVARILDYEVNGTDFTPGAQIDVTVTWEVLQPTDVPYAVFVHLITPEGLLVAQRNTYAGLGTYPTHIWRPGHVFTETYRVFLPETAYTPADLDVRIGLFNPTAGRLPVDGRDTLTIDTISLAADPADSYPNEVFINYDNHFALVGYEINTLVIWQGQKLTVTLYWQALDVPQDIPYKVFLHLKEPDGWQTFGGADGNPVYADGSTLDWVPGEIYVDERTFR
ncbi:MAG: glycosyltransferase family 39 protein, partial [Anaerolineae bacterium]